MVKKTYYLGLDKSSAKVFDIGCSTGGKLSVFESLGFSGENLFGVDLSPMAVKILRQDHPKFHAKEIKSFEYGDCFKEVQSFDLVYHSAVMCQVLLLLALSYVHNFVYSKMVLDLIYLLRVCHKRYLKRLIDFTIIILEKKLLNPRAFFMGKLV